jgi:hypothetical protein
MIASCCKALSLRQCSNPSEAFRIFCLLGHATFIFRCIPIICLTVVVVRACNRILFRLT